MVARRSLREISDLHLAVIVAGATLLGGVLTSFTNAFLIDAGTEKQTDVQLVELAIGILGEPIPEGISKEADAANTILRGWAVDTINATAPVRLGREARDYLVQGEATLLRQTLVVNGNEVEASPETIRYLVQWLRTSLRQNIMLKTGRGPTVIYVEPPHEAAPPQAELQPEMDATPSDQRPL